MLLRRGECATEERTVCYCYKESVLGEECVLLKRGECVTEDRRVLF